MITGKKIKIKSTYSSLLRINIRQIIKKLRGGIKCHLFILKPSRIDYLNTTVVEKFQLTSAVQWRLVYSAYQIFLVYYTKCHGIQLYEILESDRLKLYKKNCGFKVM